MVKIKTLLESGKDVRQGDWHCLDVEVRIYIYIYIYIYR